MPITTGQGNPNWTRDETLLALDLYFSVNGDIPSRNDKRVIELSEMLRSLPYHQHEYRKETFRNPAGVAFKLQNLKSVATMRGLPNVSKIDRTLWAEFGENSEKVKKLAQLIRDGVEFAQRLNSELDDFSDDVEFLEGRIYTRNHRRRERSAALRRKLFNLRRMRNEMYCDVCNNRGLQKVENVQDAIFEGHHVIPFTGDGERRTKLKDMSLLCANCHRMIHRLIASERRWLDIEETKRILGYK